MGVVPFILQKRQEMHGAHLFVPSPFCPFYLCYTALVWFTLSSRNFLCEIDEQIHEKLLPNRKFFLILTREFFFRNATVILLLASAF